MKTMTGRVSPLLVLALLTLWIAIPAALHAAADSAGTEFFVAFQPNTAGGESSLSLQITGPQDTTGVVEIPGLNFRQSFTVKADRITIVNLPSAAQFLGPNYGAAYGSSFHNTITRLGVHVTAQKEVTVYGLNSLGGSTDAFLSLPVEALGQEYIAMSYKGYHPSQVAVVGVYDNTQVTITPSQSVYGRETGVPFTITLNRFETFQIRSSGGGLDLTGSIITSTAPVAVMSGVDGATVPANIYYVDHLVEMMTPVAAWGKSFFTVPLASRVNGDLLHILAAYNGTKVYINGAHVSTLNRGQYYENIITSIIRIETSKPAMVAQYATSYNWDPDRISDIKPDPSMMLIPPTEQFLNRYTFSALAGFKGNYVNIVVPTDSVSSLVMDGTPVNSALFSTIGSSGFSGAQVHVSSGVHTIYGNAPFGTYVYGFGWYDSYGYPAGMALQFINQRGDTYLPNVKLTQIGDIIQGMATDSEDVNANGILDAGEDLNGNGNIDRHSEDRNGNGNIDAGEDSNGNGTLDRDTGVYKVELVPGFTNLQINILPFVPGALSVNFSISLIDPNNPGTGILRVSDGVGNSVQEAVFIQGTPALKDVRVIDTVSKKGIEIDAATFSKPPYSITDTADAVLIEWRYDAFPVNLIEDIGFDVILKNPLPGEQRTVDHKIELLYTDANGNQVRTELGPQYIQVLNSFFENTIVTNNKTYKADEAVAITATIKNLSEYARAINARVLIEDGQGTLVKEVMTLPNLNFNAGESKSFGQIAFNVGDSVAGDYKVHLVVYDGQTQVGEAFAAFAIMPTISLTSKISMDKASYNPNEQVAVSSAITSTSPNYIFENLTASFAISNSRGVNLFTAAKAISILTPGQLTEFKTYWNTATNIPGNYSATLTLTSTAGEVLSTSQANFEILPTSQTGEGLKGTIAASPSSVYQGKEASLPYSFINSGNADLSDLYMKLLIVDPVTQEANAEISRQLSVVRGETISETQTVSTVNLAPKTYLAILQAEVGGTAKTLASTTFEVLPAIEIEQSVPDCGRVLVWINDGCGNDSGQGAAAGGQKCIRKDLIEKALGDIGVTYVIVTDKKKFQAEIRNNFYTDYLILGDFNP